MLRETKAQGKLRRAGEKVLSDGTLPVLIQQGLELPEESTAYKTAEKMSNLVNEGGTPKAYDVGELARDVFAERKKTEGNTPHPSPAVTPSPQGEGLANEQESVEDVKHRQMPYGEPVKVNHNAKTERGEGIRYKIVEKDGKKRVVVTSDITQGENAVNTPSKLKKFIKNKYDTIKQSVLGKENNIVYVTSKGAGEYAFSDYTQSLEGETKWDKYRMADNIDEMIAAQIVSEYEDPSHPRSDEIVAFYRSPVEVQVGSRVYDTEVVTGITADGTEKFYDIVNLEENKNSKPYPPGPEEFRENREMGSDLPTESVPQSKTVVNSETIPPTADTDTSPYNEVRHTEDGEEISPQEESPVSDVDESATPSSRGEGSVKVVPGIRKGTWASDEFRRTRPKYYEVVDGISKRLGIAVVIDEDIDGADGYYDPKTKELHISLNSDNPIRDIVKHEITHVLEGNKAYGELISFMKEFLPSEWNSKRKAIKDKYDRINKYNKEHGKELIDDSDVAIDYETMAEFAEEMDIDSYIKRVANEKPGLIHTFRKFISEVKERLRKFLPKKELTKWEQAEQKWKKALDEAVKSGTINSEGNIEYSTKDYSEHALPEGSMVNQYRNSLTKQEWVKYYDRVNEFDWDDDLKHEEFEFVMVINGKIVKSYYDKGKPSVISVTPISNMKQSIEIEEGVIYDEDTKRILEQIAGIGKSNNKGTDIDSADILKDEGRTDEGTPATDGKKYTTHKDNEEAKRTYESGKNVKYKLKDISGIVEEKSEAEALLEAEMKLAEVEKENRAIRDLNTGLRAEIQRTKDWKINPARVEEVVSKVKDAYGSKVKTADIAARVQEIAERLHENVDSDNFERIYAQSYRELARIGEEIAEGSASFKITGIIELFTG